MVGRQPDDAAKHTGRGDTREQLVAAAIRLFAERGVHGVSLRAVGEAAGARNTAAVHYHFGDRETLLKAAVDRVVAATNDPVGLDEARALGFDLRPPKTPLHAEVALALLPTVTLPARHSWGAAGIKLLARIITGDALEAAAHLEAISLADVERFMDAVRPYLPPLPEAALHARADFAMVNLLCGLAATAYLEAAGSRAAHTAPGELAGWLIDYIAGGLAAPAGAACGHGAAG